MCIPTVDTPFSSDKGGVGRSAGPGRLGDAGGGFITAPRLAGTEVAARASQVSWWPAAAFALHPVQTQAVTYVVQRYAMCMKLGRADCAVHASATLAFLEGNSRLALRLWQQGLQVSPQHPEMHYGLGLVLEQVGEPAPAQDEFELACRLGNAGACAALESGARPVPRS